VTRKLMINDAVIRHDHNYIYRVIAITTDGTVVCGNEYGRLLELGTEDDLQCCGHFRPTWRERIFGFGEGWVFYPEIRSEDLYDEH